jgi:hypothetical protein
LARGLNVDLRRLSSSTDEPTKHHVALNPNTPSEILLKLAPEFPRAFYKNPAFDWLLLENPDLLFEMKQGVLKHILSLRDCPKSFLQWACLRRTPRWSRFNRRQHKYPLASGVRVISSTFAPRLLWGLLTGSLCCLALRYTSTLPLLRSRCSANGGRAQQRICLTLFVFSLLNFLGRDMTDIRRIHMRKIRDVLRLHLKGRLTPVFVNSVRGDPVLVVLRVIHRHTGVYRAALC